MTLYPGLPPQVDVRFLRDMIKSFIAQSPSNFMKDIDSGPIYEDALVGIADGDDPLFQQYKAIIGDFHLTPREVLLKNQEGEAGGGEDPDGVSVICVILPLARAVRVSNRKMSGGPSLLWNNANWQGQTVADEVARLVISALRERGFRAVAPDQMPSYRILDSASGPCATWSHRHAAYAAGLGAFGLSDAFITPKGAAMRCTSIVTDQKLRPSNRPYASHLANCSFLLDGSCGECIKRCPAGAISAGGHDSIKCHQELHVRQSVYLAKPGYIGKYARCGLCLTKVPCESGIPAKARKRSNG